MRRIMLILLLLISCSVFADMIIGPSPDTLLIDSYYEIDGNLIIIGEAVVIIEGAELQLFGYLWQEGNSTIIIKDDGYLHVMQGYVSQYPHFMYDSSKFIVENSTVYANTVYRSFLNDHSLYFAENANFAFWNFRECYGKSRLIIHHSNMIGDVLIRDSSYVEFVDCDTILPWFYIDSGVVLDIEFPNHDSVESFELDSSHMGLSGADWSACFDSCHTVLWGIDLANEGYANIRNSIIYLALRIDEPDTVHLHDIKNNTYHLERNIEFLDAQIILENTYLKLWCFYAYDSAYIFIDSSFWGESHARDGAQIYAVDCSTNGFPSSVTTYGCGSKYEFISGKIMAFASSWNNSINILNGCNISPIRPGIAQITNIAHTGSEMHCINCVFDTLPHALDSSVVLFVQLDSLDTINIRSESIEIYGAAWINAGPLCDDEFESYILEYRHYDDSEWNFIEENHLERYARHSYLGIWDISLLNIGEYELRLILNTIEDRHIEARMVVNINSEYVIESYLNVQKHKAYPNPFSKSVHIEIPEDADRISIYDIKGNVLFEDNQIGARHLKQNHLLWRPTSNIEKGIYLIVFRGKKSSIKKIIKF
ncbi:MAG: T9SS type A sorting domain-containing protein [Candidatus Zixiibacteriota bacterium]